MFKVKFGTPKPVMFRECWEKGDIYIDLDVEARFVGECEVLDYDKERYENEEAVSAAIKANGTAIISKCLNEDWPKGTPIASVHFKGLEDLFDKELENYSIKGQTGFVIKNLTPDSEEMFKNKMQEMTFMEYKQWDRGHFDSPLEEGKFRVVFSDSFMQIKGGQVFYAPGEPVELEYLAPASDTSYRFNINAPDVKYEFGSTIKIKFNMPEHDVSVSLSAAPGGFPPLDLAEKSMKDWIAKGILTGAPPKGLLPEVPRQNNDPEKKSQNKSDNEWICPNCFIKNTGKFCAGCGTSRSAVEWECPACKAKNTGKFCSECGTAKP